MSVGIGVIGAGVMGSDHARLIATQVQGAHLVAVADQDGTRARAAADPYDARHSADGHAVIADRDVEAVLVAAPDDTHAEYVLECLARGKPVLCEKPLAPTAAEALPVIGAEAAGGKHLIRVGFMRRFDPAYTAMKMTLREGSLGEALLFHAVHRNVSAPSWFTPANSITNAAVHEFDIVRWLFDEEIAAVTAVKPRGKAGVMPNDPLVLLVETERGALADVEVFINAAYGYEIRGELVCEQGTLELMRPEPLGMRNAGKQSRAYPPDWRGRFEDAYRLELNAWVANLGKKEAPGATAWDGFVASAVAEAGVKSLQSGAREAVVLPPKPDFYT
jgi:myo-inositol 2-dehydrogenase/D-chiro-inositol 1-dehydrogenase